MLLTNLVFISVISFVVLAFRDLSLLRTHFGPFTGIQNGNGYKVMPKIQNLKNHGLLEWDRSGSGDRSEMILAVREVDFLHREC